MVTESKPLGSFVVLAKSQTAKDGCDPHGRLDPQNSLTQVEHLKPSLNRLVNLRPGETTLGANRKNNPIFLTICRIGCSLRKKFRGII
jgi:hypothetical protein